MCYVSCHEDDHAVKRCFFRALDISYAYRLYMNMKHDSCIMFFDHVRSVNEGE